MHSLVTFSSQNIHTSIKIQQILDSCPKNDGTKNVNLQARIQDLVNLGPKLLRLKVVPSEVSNLRLGSRARLRALEAFRFLIPKYAFSHILETLFL